MRPRIHRHLGSLLTIDQSEKLLTKTLSGEDDSGEQRVVIPPEFTAHQFVLFLLHIAAEIEHSLMVEYLYAGYSLGGKQVPVEQHNKVSQWREIIFGIAKEEMGHLMTVQNLLRCLGGPLNLDRQDYPWGSEFYPFPFRLEPLTIQSLAKYVYAESPPPDKWTGEEASRIVELAMKGASGSPIHRVGDLYRQIEALLAHPDKLSNHDFRAATFPYQANWDEWGRGYKAGARGSALGNALPGTPDVAILPVSSRSECLTAVRILASQGEAITTIGDETPSHFIRFLKLFREFPKNEEWLPSRRVPVDPIVISEFSGDTEQEVWEGTRISHPVAKVWAHLFNVRYHLLLTCISHTFEYPSNLSESSELTPRGLLLNSTFGEMYNIRAIALILVDTPLSANDSEYFAGPPFQMPHTLHLPLDAVDRWRLHLDLLNTSVALSEELMGTVSKSNQVFLRMMCDVDAGVASSIELIMGKRVVVAR